MAELTTKAAWLFSLHHCCFPPGACLGSHVPSRQLHETSLSTNTARHQAPWSQSQLVLGLSDYFSTLVGWDQFSVSWEHIRSCQNAHFNRKKQLEASSGKTCRQEPWLCPWCTDCVSLNTTAQSLPALTALTRCSSEARTAPLLNSH